MVVVVLLAYPWVADALLWQYLKRQSVTVETRAVGYGGMEWTGMVVSQPGFEVAIGRISIPSVVSLVGFLGHQPVVVTNISVSLLETDTQVSQSPGDGFGAVLEAVLDSLPGLERFLPVIRIDGTTAIFPDKGQLTIGEVVWRSGQLGLSNCLWIGDLPAQWKEHFSSPSLLRLTLGRRGTSKIHYHAELSESLMLDGVLALEPDGRTNATMRGGWPDGKVELEAVWDTAGWIPGHYDLSATGSGLPYLLTNPAAQLSPQMDLQASYSVHSGAFSISIDGFGYYRKTDSGQKPLPWKLSIEADGDPDMIHVPGLKIDLPGLKASLRKDLSVDRRNFVPDQSACFEWDIDLASGIFPGLEGTATGILCLDPDPDGKRAVFSIDGTAANLLLPERIWPQRIDRATVKGEGTVDEASLEAHRIEVVADDLCEIQGSLAWQWNSMAPSPVSVEGRLLPGLLSRWLQEPGIGISPEGVGFILNAEQLADGWRHSGSISTNGVTMGDAFNADADLQWQGTGLSISQWMLNLVQADLGLSAGGSLEWDQQTLGVVIRQLEQTYRTNPAWKLLEPFGVTYRLQNAQNSSIVEWEPIKVTFSDGGRLSFEGHWSGWSDIAATGTATGLKFTSLRQWLGDSRFLTTIIDTFSFSIQTRLDPSGGYRWLGSGTLEGEWFSRDRHLVTASGSWFIDEDRTGLRAMTIGVDGTNWLVLDGNLPVSLTGSSGQPIDYVLAENNPLEINLQLEPVDALPRFLAEKLPLSINHLQAQMNATGTLSEPQANLLANAAILSWRKPGEDTLYSVNDLELNATIGVDSLRLDRLSLRLPDAPSLESVQAEVGKIDWFHLVQDPRQYPWNDLSGSARIEHWPIASLGSLLPAGLLPQGHFSVDLSKASGQLPSGNFNFEGLSWRSLDAGIIAREIAGRAHLDGRRLEELKMTAQVGGGEVRIGGWMDFANLRDPHFTIRLQSDRFDLVRRSNLILRGRSDLEAVYGELDPQPLLRGDIELIRSLWLSDLQDFTRQGVAGVSQRPPYFSVKTQPFADWRLDLNIFGQNFLRLQSTLLTGTASTEFKLRGTLGDPLLVGNVLLTDGAIIFPFGSLKTTGIEAWIAEDEPHSIKLSGTGEGVVYGYLVQYHLSGTSEMPAITFTSVPSLAQQDILLMLTTGAVPSAELTANINERTRRLGFFIGQDIFSSLIGQSGASQLEFRTGDGFSPFRREGQLLEYRMNDNWSIIGEYDDFGGYNLDVRRILLQR